MAGSAAGIAQASQIIDRNAGNVKIRVTKAGIAQVSYAARGRKFKVLAWGAANATLPAPGAKQQVFTVNYSNGFGTPYAKLGRNFPDACRRYDGPRLPWMVAACKAPDGSYWVLQRWQRMLPNYGLAPRGNQRQSELRLSHWSGELPVLTVKTDWALSGRYEHLYGSLVYNGQPLYGFKTNRFGAPLDKFGVLLYLDAFNSAYGAGWKRAISFVTHKPNGVFCSELAPRGGRPAGKGSKYRMTVSMVGALPDLYWQGTSPGRYNRAKDDAANADQAKNFPSNDCRPS
ncbi:MAG: hypothetical protein ABR521_13810 [Gaiellaceae bacterium]